MLGNICLVALVALGLLAHAGPVEAFAGFSGPAIASELFRDDSLVTDRIPPITFIGYHSNVACLSPYDPRVVFSVNYNRAGLAERRMSGPVAAPVDSQGGIFTHFNETISVPTNVACTRNMIYVSSINGFVHSVRIEQNGTLTLLGTHDSGASDHTQTVAFAEPDGTFGLIIVTTFSAFIRLIYALPEDNGRLSIQGPPLNNLFLVDSVCADPSGAFFVAVTSVVSEGGANIFTTTRFYERAFRGAGLGTEGFRPRYLGQDSTAFDGTSYFGSCVVLPPTSRDGPVPVHVFTTRNDVPVTYAFMVTVSKTMATPSTFVKVTNATNIGSFANPTLPLRCAPNPVYTTMWCTMLNQVTLSYDPYAFEINNASSTFSSLPSLGPDNLVLHEPLGRWFAVITIAPRMTVYSMTDALYPIENLEIGGDYVRPSVDHPTFRFRYGETWQIRTDAVPVANPRILLHKATTVGDSEDGINADSYWSILYPPETGHDTVNQTAVDGRGYDFNPSNLSEGAQALTTFGVGGFFVNSPAPGHYLLEFNNRERPEGTVYSPTAPVKLRDGPILVALEDRLPQLNLNPLKEPLPLKNLTNFFNPNEYASRLYSTPNRAYFHNPESGGQRLSWMDVESQNTGQVFFGGEIREVSYDPIDNFWIQTSVFGGLVAMRHNETTNSFTQVGSANGLPDFETDTPISVHIVPNFDTSPDTSRTALYAWRRGLVYYVSTVPVHPNTLSISVPNFLTFEATTAVLVEQYPDSEMGIDTPTGVTVEPAIDDITRQWVATVPLQRPVPEVPYIYSAITRRLACLLTYSSRIACGLVYGRTDPGEFPQAMRNVNDTAINGFAEWALTEVGLVSADPQNEPHVGDMAVAIVGHPWMEIFVLVYPTQVRVFAVRMPKSEPGPGGMINPPGQLVHIDTEIRGSRCTVAEYGGASNEYLFVACGSQLIVYFSSLSTGLLTFDRVYSFTDPELGNLGQNATIRDISVFERMRLDVLVDEGGEGLSHLHTFLVDPDPPIQLANPSTGSEVWASPEGAQVVFFTALDFIDVRLVYVRTDGETESEEIFVGSSNLDFGGAGEGGFTYYLQMWNNETTLPYTPGLQGRGRVAVEVLSGESWSRSLFVQNVTFYSYCESIPVLDPWTGCQNCTWRFEERSTGMTFCGTCVAGLYTAPEAAPSQFCYLNESQCAEVRCSGHGTCIEGRYLEEPEGATCACSNYSGPSTWGTTYMGHHCEMEPWECRDANCGGQGSCPSARMYDRNCTCLAPGTGPSCDECLGHFVFIELPGPHNFSRPVAGCARCSEGFYGVGCNLTEPVCTGAVPGAEACAACVEITDAESGVTLPSATTSCGCYRDIFNQSLDPTCVSHFCGSGLPSDTELGVCDCDEGRFQSASEAHALRQCILDCVNGEYSYATDTCLCDESYSGTLCSVSLETEAATPAAIVDPEMTAGTAIAIAIGVVAVTAMSVAAYIACSASAASVAL